MQESTILWFSLTIFSTMVMSFYSVGEMACISCNRLRLAFAQAQGKRWAIWLQELLNKPSHFFSTTLIGVNVALMISSESMRQLFSTIGIDPTLSSIIHIPFVLIFGELVPMFAARLYADHVSRLGIPILWATSRILYPINTAIDYFFQRMSALLGLKTETKKNVLISRDELQRLLQDHQWSSLEETPYIPSVINSLFTLKSIQVVHLMRPLDDVTVYTHHPKVCDIYEFIQKHPFSFCLVFNTNRKRLQGIISLRSILSAPSNKRVDEYIVPCLYAPENTELLELFILLQKENQPLAVLIDQSGKIKGVVFREDIVEKMFVIQKHKKITTHKFYLEKTFPATYSLELFDKQYGTKLSQDSIKTFADLLEKQLDRTPSNGDIIRIGSLEIQVKKVSLFRAKTILVRATGTDQKN